MFVVGGTGGALYGPAQGSGDAWIARITGSGATDWALQWGTADQEAYSFVAPDGAGGVVVAGGGQDFQGTHWKLVARYDGLGNQLWSAQFATGPGGTGLFGLASDGAGGAIVVGGTLGDPFGPSQGGAYDAWIARFDASGNQVFAHQVGTPGYEIFWGVTSDGAGGAIVTGQSDSGALGGTSFGGADLLIARYDGLGNVQWIHQYGTSDVEVGRSVASDGAGGWFVGGRSYGSFGGSLPGPGSDALIARFDANGALQWARQFGGPETDTADVIASDGSGGCFAAGFVRGNWIGPHIGGEFDWWYGRFDGAGNPLLLEKLGTTDHDQLAPRIAYDVDSGLWLCGQVLESLFAPLMGTSDAWLMKLDACGFEGALAYCVGAPNSVGPGAVIGAAGTTFIASNDLSLTVEGCPAQQLGIFIMAPSQNSLPFGDGILCVGGSVQRLMPAVVLGSLGSGSLPLDVTNSNSPASQITAGSTWNFQFWYRDPAAGLSGFNLSNGLSVTFCP